jgi:hypothetical protein
MPTPRCWEMYPSMLEAYLVNENQGTFYERRKIKME